MCSVGREEKNCRDCRAHSKEENKSHVCIPRSPPKVKDFTSVLAAAWPLGLVCRPQHETDSLQAPVPWKWLYKEETPNPALLCCGSCRTEKADFWGSAPHTLGNVLPQPGCARWCTAQPCCMCPGNSCLCPPFGSVGSSLLPLAQAASAQPQNSPRSDGSCSLPTGVAHALWHPALLSTSLDTKAAIGSVSAFSFPSFWLWGSS